MTALLTADGRLSLAAASGRGYRALRVRPGAKSKRLKGRARPFGRGVRATKLRRGSRIVFGVRRGRVTFVAVASREASRTRASLRHHLSLAGLR